MSPAFDFLDFAQELFDHHVTENLCNWGIQMNCR